MIDFIVFNADFVEYISQMTFDVNTIVNIVIVGIFGTSIISNVVLRKIAAHKQKPVPFLWTSCVYMNMIMASIFLFCTIIGIFVESSDIQKYPRWFSITYVSMTVTPALSEQLILCGKAFAIAMIPPIISIITSIITTSEVTIKNATFVAICVLYLKMCIRDRCNPPKK